MFMCITITTVSGPTVSKKDVYLPWKMIKSADDSSSSVGRLVILLFKFLLPRQASGADESDLK